MILSWNEMEGKYQLTWTDWEREWYIKHDSWLLHPNGLYWLMFRIG